MCTFIVTLIVLSFIDYLFCQVSDKLSQLKVQFEALLKDREAAYKAKIEEITANSDRGAVCVQCDHKKRKPLVCSIASSYLNKML